MRKFHFGLLAAAAASLASDTQGSAQNPLPVATPVVQLERAAQLAPPTVAPPDATPTTLPPATPTTLASPRAFDTLQEITGCPCPTAETPPAPANPYAGPLMERSHLAGDWLGARSAMAGRGMTWDVSNTNFYSGITRGGVEQRFRYRGRADYILNIDGEKAGLWKGFFVTLHGESVWGDSINSSSGALLPVSIGQALPVPTGSVTALTGVKFTQALSENFVLFAGKLNTLDDLNQPFTGGSRGVNGFQNTGMVFNPVFARTVPYSTYGAGFAILKDLQPVFAFNVLDTNNTPTVTGFDTFFDNGVTLLAQVNVPTKFFGLPGHQGLTGTWSSGRYTTLDPTVYIDPIQGLAVQGPRLTDSWSLGYSFDQALYVSSCDPKRMWGVFGNLGMADNNPSPVRWFANIGIGGSSPLRGRKLDTFGIGYYYLGVSEELRNLAPRLLPLNDEQGVEMFYNVAVTPWFHFTPDLQVIIPGRERINSPLFFGLRGKIDF